MVDLGKVSGSGGEDPPDWQNEIGCWATGSNGSSTGLSVAYYPIHANYGGGISGYASNGGSPGGQDGMYETNKTVTLYRRTIMCNCMYMNDICYTRLYDETAATAISSYSHTQAVAATAEYSTESGNPLVIYNLDANHEVYAQAKGSVVDRVMGHVGIWEARILDR